MQLTVRSRDQYKYFLLHHDRRDQVLNWKKGRGPFPADIYDLAVGVIQRYFSGFDVVTVPAPSFHTYRNHGYPIWELAKKLRGDSGFTLKNLFPKPSGKTRKHFTGWRQKEIQHVQLRPGLFVLVVDDIVTTGHTMRITYEAILRKGSYPCGVVLA
jgi:predicted amidophosphoribosyltransferase